MDVRKITVFSFLWLLGLTVSAHAMSLGTLKKAALRCETSVNSAALSARALEITRLWDYLDRLRQEDAEGIRRKSKRLMVEIEALLYEQQIQFEPDPQDPYFGRLIKVLEPQELKGAHPLNRLATSFYRIHRGARIEINPRKLKLSDAGALFDETTRRLTLAADNVIELKSDSFLGHEIRHAFATHLVDAGLEHLFMGWLKQKEGGKILHETYPDAMSLDEYVAYYYQVIVLLREAKKRPEHLEVAGRFAQIASELVSLLVPKDNPEVLQFALTYLKQNQNLSFRQEKGLQIVVIELPHHILELEFIDQKSSQAELIKKALNRVAELGRRAREMKVQFEKTVKAIENKQPLDQILQNMSERRDLIQQRP